MDKLTLILFTAALYFLSLLGGWLLTPSAQDYLGTHFPPAFLATHMSCWVLAALIGLRILDDDN